MNIQSIQIKNYKSLVDFKLVSPNAFSVFVGPNAAGKSNIFEALELFALSNVMEPWEAARMFGKREDLVYKNSQNDDSGAKKILFVASMSNITPSLGLMILAHTDEETSGTSGHFEIAYSDDMKGRSSNKNADFGENSDYKHFFNFSRIFAGNAKLVKRNIQDDKQLSIDASNLEKVLKRLLQNENIKSEIIEWLQLLIPGFDNIEIISEPLSGSDNLLIYEKGINKPFTKNLLSDGTHNILAILAAVYQSDKPQFLCIEEPENGLNPKVIRELVNLFREKCKEGHFIWLNTHSQSLVSELTTDEIILVDKKDGETVVKQIQGMDLHGLKMDEALLTNALGGGIPW